MAEYNRVMKQIKPELPKVLDTEQIYVYVPIATYNQAGIVKPDETQFVVAGDYTLTIKHFTMTDSRVSVDVNMGYDNDIALDKLDDKDFVTKKRMTDYAVKRLENSGSPDKAYVEGAAGTGTKLVPVSTGADSDTIAKRGLAGQLYATSVAPTAQQLTNKEYNDNTYVQRSTSSGVVYAVGYNGADTTIPYDDLAEPGTVARRNENGELYGQVSATPADETLINKQYLARNYIPVGSDGKIPNSYLPANIGADEIVMGYFYQGDFYLDKDHTVQAAYDTEKLYVDIDTNMTYRWSVTEDYSGFVEISSSLALGTTHDSAYYGDFGDAAYTHSLTKGNPHGTAIADISGLSNQLNRKLAKSHDDNDINRYRVAMYCKQGESAILYKNRTDVYLNGTKVATNSTAIKAGDIITMPGDAPAPIVNGVLLSASTASIAVPLGMILIDTSESTVSPAPEQWKITIRAADFGDTLPVEINQNAIAYTLPMRDRYGRLRTADPGSISAACLNLAFWYDNYKPFSYTNISTLSSVDKGFNVEYHVNGESAEIEIPLEGTDDIVVDIDETNKMINIHLDAAVRAKLAKMLTLPATAPAKNSIVGVGTNNAQMIMTEQEARDAINVFKTVSLTQTEYNNLATKDSKTLYLITG